MLPAIALGTALGLALAPWVAGGPWPLLALPGLWVLRKWPLWMRLAAMLLLIGPAAWWGDFRTPTPGARDICFEAPRRFYRLTGTVASPPEPVEDGWRAEVEAADGRGRLRVTWPSHARPGVGDRWTWAGRLSRPHGPDNPGEPDAVARLAARGLFATMTAETGTRLGPDARFRVPAAIDALRTRLVTGLGRGLSAEQAALFGSLTLGAGAAPVDGETATAFRRLGLSHLLAASGSQVSLLAGLLYGFARWARLSPGWAAALAAPGVVLYWLLTGAPPSMTRATIMGLVGLLGLGMARRSRPFAALWLAAWVMLVVDPACLNDLGWQFSVLATYALTRLARFMQAHPLPGPDWAWSHLFVPVVAWAWVSPWQLQTFHTWSWLALPANWLAAPLIMGLTPWGLAVSVLGASCPPIAAFTSPLTAFVVGLLQHLVSAMSSAPGLDQTHPGWPLWALAALYGALWCGLRRPRTALALAAVVLMASFPDAHVRPLEISFLSVGQGDAIALRTPRGRWVLIDAGPAGDGQDAGARVVLPYLRRGGCRRIDLMVATHAHRDHIGGLPAIAAAMPIEEAWDAGQSEADGCNQELLAAWLTRAVPWRRARPGMGRDIDGVRLRVLAPGASPHGVNDGSVVVRLDYGGFSALFTGDAEGPSERDMLAADRLAPVTVLKVGHHGSKTSTTPGFLKAVSPRLAVVSVGRHNRFSHPTPQVMRRLHRAGAAIARTDLAGCVRVRSDGRTWAWTTGPDAHAPWQEEGRAGIERPRRAT